MKQYEINNAYPSLAKLLTVSLPIKKAREVFNMYTALEASYNFAVREQQKYLDEHNMSIVNGLFKFAGENKEEDYAAFMEQLNELLNSEVDIDVNTIEITEEDMGKHTISAADILNLRGLVSFE